MYPVPYVPISPYTPSFSHSGDKGDIYIGDTRAREAVSPEKQSVVSTGTQSREDFARTARRYFGDGLRLTGIEKQRQQLAAWGWL